MSIQFIGELLDLFRVLLKAVLLKCLNISIPHLYVVSRQEHDFGLYFLEDAVEIVFISIVLDV